MSKYLIRGFLLLLTTGLCAKEPSVVHLRFHGCRTGDRLIHYVKGRWVAKKLGLEMVIGRKCTRMNQFSLIDMHTDVDQPGEELNLKNVTLTCENDIKRPIKRGHQVHIGFSYKDNDWECPFEVGSWKNVMADRDFRDEICKAFAPKYPSRDNRLVVKPPAGVVSVALHIRTGEGVDRPRRSPPYYDFTKGDLEEEEILYGKSFRQKYGGFFSDVIFSIKFPTRQYYLDQLRRIYKHFGGQDLYVYIFTDSKDSGELMCDLRDRLNLPNVTFEHYAGRKKISARVRSDFWSMTNFDCLIRGGSNYAQLAHLIGRHKVVIYPKSFFWARGCLVMDDIVMEVND